LQHRCEREFSIILTLLDAKIRRQIVRIIKVSIIVIIIIIITIIIIIIIIRVNITTIQLLESVLLSELLESG